MKGVHKSILITGISGSGKSSVSRELRKLGYKSYSIEDMKGLFLMIDRKTGKRSKNFNSLTDS